MDWLKQERWITDVVRQQRKEYRILDETSISFGTAEPTGNGRKGDIYIQTSDSANGWKKLLQFIIIPTE